MNEDVSWSDSAADHYIVWPDFLWSTALRQLLDSSVLEEHVDEVIQAEY